MRSMEVIIIPVVMAGLFTACDDAATDGQRAAPQVSEQDLVVEYKVDLVPGTHLSEALAHTDTQPARSITISWADHERSWDVGEGTTADDILDEERELLGYLITQFDADDVMEGPVHAALSDDLARLDDADDAPVSSMVFRDQAPPLALLDSGLVSEVVRRELAIDEELEDHADLDAAAASITDYTGDGPTTPAGGTSTIGKSGTLQKFWLDSEAKSSMSAFEDGLEVETWSKKKAWVKCTSDGASTNMPYWYYDTEFMDSSGYRNCAIGTLDSEHLSTWKLYWTWIPFSTYKKAENPTHVVAFQKMSWCPWIGSWSACSAAPAGWCMCADSTEWAVSYRYTDASGGEVGWDKD